MAEVVTGPGRTCLSDREFVVEFELDRVEAGAGDAYLRMIPRTEMDIAVAGAAARVRIGDGVCLAASVALGAVAPTVVVANRDEARFLLRDRTTFPETTWSVVTSGQRDTVITHANGEYRRLTPPPAELLDSTGAGDAFTGGFIAALLRSETPVDAVRAGHRLAALTLREPGAGLRSDR